MALCGKVFTEFESEVPAAKFYNIFRKQLQHIPNIAEDVHGATLLEGEWDKAGSVIHWEYTIDGEEESAKGKIETIDDDNRVITFSLFDGNVSENYKSFKGTLQVMDGEYGAFVRWTFEYEKVKEDITGAVPVSYLDLVADVTKDIDAHFVEEEQQI
ncbi:MLP-like protein 43 isoform X1 [Vicia villosa]|uniref:MLP-like protein 43 isoform X1 n=1 Tax=Vicia villosa TaxID=3911 RepID=UPI00273A8062|nr:MLP-like protein 43 isoform X1 [Vicia villosa]